MKINNVIMSAVSYFIAGLTVACESCGGGGSTTTQLDATFTNTDSEKANKATLPSVVWVDASGSMKGYFNTPEGQPNKFVDVLTKVAYYPQESPIYFVGQNKPFKGIIADIIKDLRQQPNESASEFAPQIDSLMRLPDGQMGFIVTDGIVYVGKNTGTAMQQVQQQLANVIHKEKAAAILRYNGQFTTSPKGAERQKGSIKYFDKSDTPICGLDIPNRPFYVIAVGSKENIRQLRDDAKKDLLADDILCFGIHDLEGCHYNNGQAEEYVLEPTADTYTLRATLPPCMDSIPDDFVKDNLLLEINNKEVDKAAYSTLVNNKNIEINISATPIAALLQGGDNTFAIKITNPVPQQWKNLSCNDDAQIADMMMLQTQTFGLMTLIEGLRQGFGEAEDKLLFNIVLKAKNE